MDARDKVYSLEQLCESLTQPVFRARGRDHATGVAGHLNQKHRYRQEATSLEDVAYYVPRPLTSRLTEGTEKIDLGMFFQPADELLHTSLWSRSAAEEDDAYLWSRYRTETRELRA
jgi:hypothetical protein